MAHSNTILVFTEGENIYEGFIKLHFIKALRQAYRNSHISWYSDGSSVYTSTLKSIADAFLDKVYEQTSFNQLWKYKYDLIIDTQTDFLKSLRLKLLRHHKIISSSSKYIFSSYKPHDNQAIPIHNLKRLIALTSLAGQPLSLVKKRLPLPSEYRERAVQILPVNKKYIGLIVGAGMPFKCWPLNNFIALALIVVEKGYTPAFILGPQEHSWLSQIKREIPEALFPLQDSQAISSHLFTVAIGERLYAAVANDCGIGHLMSAAEIPLVSLFGKTNAEKVCPIVEKGCFIRSQDFGSDEISAIPVNAVANSLDQLLTKIKD
ncbi:MAG: hypothetical protein J0H12_07195 [Candidatus Paracaedimonas acanthamoebae]|uniref:ADP-heptose--LPS heptosyltransferase n=1 Tax=Candidatus Paracaedimonas acanthamoebae TaxID=244581 RepID=A0A8J7PK27_9PROT|nr:hypothetical protein [Candidatus Paracaedimonas acanthamoebae]